MSQLIQLKDKYGNSLNFGNGGDVWLPPFSNIRDYRQHLNNIRHLELEPDDVIIAGFPKSGKGNNSVQTCLDLEQGKKKSVEILLNAKRMAVKGK